MRIGFVGLGLMGEPMVRNLLAARFEVVAQGQAAALDRLVAAGARRGGAIADIAAEVDVFCSCRVTPEQSVATFLDGGVLDGARPGLLTIDFATIDPATARRIAERLGAASVAHLDAPISGGPDGAAARTLTILAGGPAEAVERARPAFAAVGEAVLHMGPAGAGVTTKLCNNMISITTHALVAEAFVLGVKAGVEPRALYEALRASSAWSRSLDRALPGHVLTRDFTPAASIATIMKDLVCAIDTARALGVPLSLPPVALARYADAVRGGHGESDITAVILPIEETAGVTVGPA